MSRSRKKLLTVFLLATAALTGIILISEKKKVRQTPPATTPGLDLPLPRDKETLRIGFFEVGPEDVEPRLFDEAIVGIDRPFHLELEHPARMVCWGGWPMGYSIGVGLPTLLSLPEEWSIDDRPEQLVIDGEVETRPKGARYLSMIDSWRFSHETCTRGEFVQAVSPVVRVLVQPVDSWTFEPARTTFVLCRTEGNTTGHWNLEQWREAIAEGLRQTDPIERANNTDPARYIPCPAARETLAADPDDEYRWVARMMAGDPRVPNHHGWFWGWQCRTVWLLYPELRAQAKSGLLSGDGQTPYAGPNLLKRFHEDPELERFLTRPSPPIDRDRVVAAVGFLLAALLFLLPALVAEQDPSRAAGWVLAGCIGACLELKVNGFDYLGALGMLVLFAGALRLCRSVRPMTIAARCGMLLVLCVVVCQAWKLLGEPSLVSQLGSLAYGLVPLALLAATDPLVAPEARVATDRTLWCYSFANLLLPVALLLVNLIDTALGRNTEGWNLGGWLALPLLALPLLGLFVVAVGFGKLRGRMRALADASPE